MGILGLHVTTFNFMHLRSTRKLSKKVKRLARKLHAIMEHIKDKNQDVYKYFEEGNEIKEFKAWESLLNMYSNEEDIIGDMTFKEEIIEHDEIKDENKDENILHKLENKLGSNKERIAHASKVFSELHSFLKKALDKLRLEMRDMYKDYSSGILKYQHMVGDKQVYWDIKNLAVEERLDIQNLTNDENELTRLIYNLEHGKDEKDTIRDCEKLNVLADKISSEYRSEFSHIINLVHHIDLIQIKFLHILDSLEEKWEQLKKEGFSKKYLLALKADLQKLKDDVNEERDKLFHGARYNEHSLN